MSGVALFNKLNTRKTSVVRVGGFRPTGDPLASHFGLRPVAAPGENWPACGDQPLQFICQLNLTAAPARPSILQDIHLVTFFVHTGDVKLGRENGENWRLRTYKSLDGLTALHRPSDAAALKRGFECRWEALEDHPNYDDPEKVLPEGFDDSDVDLENLDCTKLGGYASSIQSEPWWGREDHPARPSFCLQVASEEKIGLNLVDGGIVYLARGTAAGCEDRWFLDLQFY